MERFRRFALYYMPSAREDWAQAATAWLGWDASAGCVVDRPDLDGLPLPIHEITATPARYGLHATIKPPFAIAPDRSPSELVSACAEMCAHLPAVSLDGLSIERMGRFIALRPVGDETALNRLAADCVRNLDRFRAPPNDDDLARRRKSKLSPAQDEMLQRWGYPYVLDEFRFHITLSGPLTKPHGREVHACLERYLARTLPKPFTLDGLALAGEASDGRFHLCHRFPLGEHGTTERTVQNSPKARVPQ